MNREGRRSLVAYCQKCKGYVMACHTDFIEPETWEEFNEAIKHGFTVKTETIHETKSRKFTEYDKCKRHNSIVTDHQGEAG